MDPSLQGYVHIGTDVSCGSEEIEQNNLKGVDWHVAQLPQSGPSNRPSPSLLFHPMSELEDESLINPADSALVRSLIKEMGAGREARKDREGEDVRRRYGSSGRRGGRLIEGEGKCRTVGGVEIRRQ